MLTTSIEPERTFAAPASGVASLGADDLSPWSMSPSSSPYADLAASRQGYQAPGSSRLVGGLGTVSLCTLILAGFFITLGHIEHRVTPSVPLSVALLPLSSPKPAVQKSVEEKKPLVRKVETVMPKTVDPQPRLIVALPAAPASPTIPSVPQISSVPSTPSKPMVATPAPTPPTVATAPHGPDKWEGRVLARLERFRRYPTESQHAHQEGTAYLRFRIDRAGHVLTSAIERSSGYPALDAAALETLRRADPLPKVPTDRPDEVELVVPVEFSVAR